MQKYSFLSLARNALTYHENWQRAWRSPDPKPEYDVVIVGGGGHGLATAYYLVKEHRVGSVAVVEKGYVGEGASNVYRYSHSAGALMLPRLSLQMWFVTIYIIPHSAARDAGERAGSAG